MAGTEYVPTLRVAGPLERPRRHSHAGAWEREGEDEKENHKIILIPPIKKSNFSYFPSFPIICSKFGSQDKPLNVLGKAASFCSVSVYLSP
jgi:hypothetical protein